jgi:plastocyanin
MNNKIVTTIVLAVLVVAGVTAVALNNKSDKSESMSDSMNGMSEMDKGSSASNAESSTAVQETNTVTYKNFDVLPKNIKVKKGTTVTWTNEDSAKHDVTPETETADFKATELFGKGESASITFNTVGKFNYFCSPHPYMKGTVEVVE